MSNALKKALKAAGEILFIYAMIIGLVLLCIIVGPQLAVVIAGGFCAVAFPVAIFIETYTKEKAKERS